MSALVRSMLEASLAEPANDARTAANAVAPAHAARLCEDFLACDGVLEEIKRRGMWWAAGEILRLRRSTRCGGGSS